MQISTFMYKYTCKYTAALKNIIFLYLYTHPHWHRDFLSVKATFNTQKMQILNSLLKSMTLRNSFFWFGLPANNIQIAEATMMRLQQFRKHSSSTVNRWINCQATFSFHYLEEWFEERNSSASAIPEYRELPHCRNEETVTIFRVSF